MVIKALAMIFFMFAFSAWGLVHLKQPVNMGAENGAACVNAGAEWPWRTEWESFSDSFTQDDSSNSNYWDSSFGGEDYWVVFPRAQYSAQTTTNTLSFGMCACVRSFTAGLNHDLNHSAESVYVNFYVDDVLVGSMQHAPRPSNPSLPAVGAGAFVEKAISFDGNGGCGQVLQIDIEATIVNEDVHYWLYFYIFGVNASDQDYEVSSDGD